MRGARRDFFSDTGLAEHEHRQRASRYSLKLAHHRAHRAVGDLDLDAAHVEHL